MRSSLLMGLEGQEYNIINKFWTNSQNNKQNNKKIIKNIKSN